jgi:hypothetical protein
LQSVASWNSVIPPVKGNGEAISTAPRGRIASRHGAGRSDQSHGSPGTNRAKRDRSAD